MALPELTYEQRKAASEKAVAARQARAELLRKVKHGEVDFVEVLDSDDPIVARTRAYYLIKAVPGVGVTKAERLMDDIGIAKSRRIQGLSPRQHDALVAWFTYGKLWEKVDAKEIAVKDVLYSDDPIVQQMPVVDLIAAVHGYGKTRAGKLMFAASIMSTAKLSDLDDYKKSLLVKILDDGEPWD